MVCRVAPSSGRCHNRICDEVCEQYSQVRSHRFVDLLLCNLFFKFWRYSVYRSSTHWHLSGERVSRCVYYLLRKIGPIVGQFQARTLTSVHQNIKTCNNPSAMTLGKVTTGRGALSNEIISIVLHIQRTKSTSRKAALICNALIHLKKH